MQQLIKIYNDLDNERSLNYQYDWYERFYDEKYKRESVQDLIDDMQKITYHNIN